MGQEAATPKSLFQKDPEALRGLLLEVSSLRAYCLKRRLQHEALEALAASASEGP